MNSDKFKEIIDGWKNYMFPTEEIEELAKARAEICSDCGENDLGVCGECCCPLFAKTRSPESTCPLNKW